MVRLQALDGFKRGLFPVLVATDVAARGLDITGVELVIMVGVSSPTRSGGMSEPYSALPPAVQVLLMRLRSHGLY
jgi:hypothetical protein